MFKRMTITLFICIVLSLSVVGFIIYKDINESSSLVKKQPSQEVTDESNHSKEIPAVSEDNDAEESKDLNPFGKSTRSKDMTVLHTEDYIHGMSHQKVIAEAKWGFYEITDERIDWLLDVVQQKDFANKKVYEVILMKWNKGDFSQVIEDHNSIWRLQGGAIGKATGVLSAEEEKAYIESQKKK